MSFSSIYAGERQMFLENQKKKDCCGCMACSKICGFGAIQMKQDSCGFDYPQVNKSLCKECGLCETVCPMKENYVGADANPDIYAVKNKKKNVLENSSSGGMFTLLAEWVIGQRGIVYGVAFNRDFSVCHQRAETIEEAMKFRTSKYVESNPKKVYDTILEDLKAEKIVLLTGTPCQISGIVKYLKKKKANLDFLYTCDNICHGVPSKKVWKDYLEILNSKYIASDDEILSINMRSKKVSWKKQVMDIKLKKGNIDKVIEKFSFNQFFLSLFGNRPSCFHCRYTSYKRVSDFTLGDFWNVENANITFDVEGGVNVVLVNTSKGKKLFEELKKKADMQSVTKETCWQPHLEYSAKPPAKRKEFWREYNQTDEKEKIIRKYMKGSLLTRIIRTVSPFLRKTGLYGFAGKMYKIMLVERRK